MTFNFGSYNVAMTSPREDLPYHLKEFDANFPAWAKKIDPNATTLSVALPPRKDMKTDWLTEFLAPLHHAFMQHGFTPFHGAIRHEKKRLLLIAGPSGSGKSLFSLLLNNWGDLLADDLFFIRLHGDVIDVIPIPRKVASKSPMLRGISLQPQHPMQTQFRLEDITLVFPRFSPTSGLTLITEAKERFFKIVAGNIYGDLSHSIKNATLQISVRKQLSERCRAYDVRYADVNASLLTQELLHATQVH